MESHKKYVPNHQPIPMFLAASSWGNHHRTGEAICGVSWLCSHCPNPDWVIIPSGKLPHNYGKSPFWMGKSTISMAIFNSKLFVSQRVIPNNPWFFITKKKHYLSYIYIHIYINTYIYISHHIPRFLLVKSACLILKYLLTNQSTRVFSMGYELCYIAREYTPHMSH